MLSLMVCAHEPVVPCLGPGEPPECAKDNRHEERPATLQAWISHESRNASAQALVESNPRFEQASLEEPKEYRGLKKAGSRAEEEEPTKNRNVSVRHMRAICSDVT